MTTVTFSKKKIVTDGDLVTFNIDNNDTQKSLLKISFLLIRDLAPIFFYSAG